VLHLDARDRSAVVATVVIRSRFTPRSALIRSRACVSSCPLSKD
jgi:hypothetical protein